MVSDCCARGRAHSPRRADPLLCYWRWLGREASPADLFAWLEAVGLAPVRIVSSNRDRGQDPVRNARAISFRTETPPGSEQPPEHRSANSKVGTTMTNPARHRRRAPGSAPLRPPVRALPTPLCLAQSNKTDWPFHLRGKSTGRA